MGRLINITALMGKEFASLIRDLALLAFAIYAFSFAIYSPTAYRTRCTAPPSASSMKTAPSFPGG